MDDDRTEWTEEERAALEGLARDVDPGSALEERTVAALRERGLLAGGGAEPVPTDPEDVTSLPARRAASERPRPHPAWWAAAAAAAVALFLGGVTVGQARGARAAGELVVAMHTAGAAERAALVQQTGSLYVEALAGLAELQARGNDEAVATGTEVARSALLSATVELARLNPDDARWARILGALGDAPGGAEAQADGGADGDSPVRRVLWF